MGPTTASRLLAWTPGPIWTWLAWFLVRVRFSVNVRHLKAQSACESGLVQPSGRVGAKGLYQGSPRMGGVSHS